MLLCESCLRRHWKAKIDKRTGLQIKHKNGNLVYVCIYCGHVQEENNEFIETHKDIQANILYVDTENSKSIYGNYGAKVPSKYLRTDDLIQAWYMFGWCASYHGSDAVFSAFVTGKESIACDDSRITRKLWGLMNSAEIIAGHNVAGFDLKKINTVFMKHGLPALDKKQTIDTLKLARSCLSLESNKLDYVSQWLGFSGKDEITNEDWWAAQGGHTATLKKIERYCVGDVVNGKNVLTKFLPLAHKPAKFGARKK